MANKLSYKKRAVNYIIGVVVLAISFGGAVLGVPLDKNKTTLGLSLGESEAALSQSFRESEAELGLSLGESAADKDLKGYYLIRTADDLKNFVDKVNNGETKAKGILVNNIVFNEGGVVEKGKLKAGNLKKWTPIGTEGHPFEGEFEGNGKTISGLYINNNENYQGLFGDIIKEGEVRNVTINSSYVNGNENVGVIAGKNEGKIINCIINDNIVEGKKYVGGNIGWNAGTIEGECKNEGKVKGESNVGGMLDGMKER